MPNHSLQVILPDGLITGLCLMISLWGWLLTLLRMVSFWLLRQTYEALKRLLASFLHPWDISGMGKRYGWLETWENVLLGNEMARKKESGRNQGWYFPGDMHVFKQASLMKKRKHFFFNHLLGKPCLPRHFPQFLNPSILNSQFLNPNHFTWPLSPSTRVVCLMGFQWSAPSGFLMGSVSLNLLLPRLVFFTVTSL